MDSFPIWVHLPGLPPHLWSVKVFQAIGNMLGTYLDADFSFREMGEMALAHILVSLNIRGGLQKELNITDRGRTRAQILDYEGIPFRCRHCHAHGHILKYFPLSFCGFHTLLGLPRQWPIREGPLHRIRLHPLLPLPQTLSTLQVVLQGGSTVFRWCNNILGSAGYWSGLPSGSGAGRHFILKVNFRCLPLNLF
jgi:hypothetical protein